MLAGLIARLKHKSLHEYDFYPYVSTAGHFAECSRHFRDSVPVAS
jgi:hypothetical protein